MQSFFLQTIPQATIGRYAAGKRHRLVASSFPILPGRTESILLALEQDPRRSGVELAYPLELKGRIEVGGKRVDISESVWPADE